MERFNTDNTSVRSAGGISPAFHVFARRPFYMEYSEQHLQNLLKDLYGGDNRLEIYDISRFYDNVVINGNYRPVIGEDETRLTTFLGFVVIRRPVLITSGAGGGKTVIMDATSELIPETKRTIIAMGSKKAIWGSIKDLQKHEFVILPEFQKASANVDAIDMLEVLKDWGEGKTARYNRMDITKGKETEVVLLPPRPFMTSLATENEHGKIGPELGRRVIEVHTNCTKEQTEKVIESKLLREALPHKTKSLKDVEYQLIKLHVKNVIEEVGTGPFIINPMAMELTRVVPTIYKEARSVIDYLIDMIKACTMFYFYDRPNYYDGETKVYFSTPADNWIAWKIYGRQFVESCLKIPQYGLSILTLLPQIAGRPSYSSTKDPDEILAGLLHMGITMTKADLKKVLGTLVMNSYLSEMPGEKKTDPIRYYRGALSANYDNPLDWNEVIEKTLTLIKEEYPSIEEEYLKHCGIVKDNVRRLEIVDPIAGNIIDILAPNVPIETKPDHIDLISSRVGEIDLQISYDTQDDVPFEAYIEGN